MDHRLLCARPGCQGPTAAWLTYDYAGQRVWLDDAPQVGGGDQWALCAGHAGRLRAPQGWTQVDRRVTRPSRFDAQPSDPPAGAYDEGAGADDERAGADDERASPEERRAS